MERLRGRANATIRQLLPELPYLQVVQAKVLRDHGNHTVDVEPLDRAWPMVTEVPYEIPLAGARVRVKPGAILLLGFEGGDARGKHALAFRSGELEYVEIRCGSSRIEMREDRITIQAARVDINS